MTTDVDRALYETAHDFPGGVPALATRLGRATGTIHNKADPGCETHQFAVREALAMMLASRDYRVLRTLARATGHAVIPHGDFSDTSDVELLQLYARLHQEIGETSGAIRQALEGREIGRERVATIRREIHEDIEAALELLSRIEAISRD